jgi:hypothetical protein
MCFRPASVTMDLTCPQCGAKNPPTATACVQCKATAEELAAGTPAMPALPGAPGAPPPPGASGMPKPPGAPGVPKAPQGPNKP